MIKDHKKSKQLKQRSCSKCDKVFEQQFKNGNNLSIRDQKITHLINVHLDLQCLECINVKNLEILMKRNLRKMPKKVDQYGKPAIFKCIVCKEIFHKKDLLAKHSHVHDMVKLFNL